MTKQVNPNIGHVCCPFCGELSAVRKNRGGRFYFDCLTDGRITPNHAGGQKWLMENATIWGAAGAPDELPAWIREQWSYGKSMREGRQPDPAPAPEPDTAAPPPPAAAPGIATLPPPPKRDTQPAEPARPRGFSFLE